MTAPLDALFGFNEELPSPVAGPIVVTGTDTGVGKTIVTAAIAAAATAAGLSVAVVKPAQTGTADGEEPDALTVARLAEPVTTRTLASFPDPLAPPQLAIRSIAEGHDVTLVEGAGGLLVPLGEGGWTALDLAAALGATAVVVARAGLGTLNHTALTLESLERREVPALVVFGAWPAEPELVHRTNLHDLPGDLVGAIPDGAGAMTPEVFRREAPHWLDARLYGRFDPVAFRSHSR